MSYFNDNVWKIAKNPASVEIQGLLISKYKYNANYLYINLKLWLVTILNAIKNYRTTWLANGSEWFETKDKPVEWLLENQLKNIPNEYL